MELTKDEQEVCDVFGKRGNNGLVRCSECPLAIDTRLCICKANISREEWEEYKMSKSLNRMRGKE